MSDDSNTDVVHNKPSTKKRRPLYLVRSTLIGLGLGLLVGIGYMVLARNPDGSGVKGTEWLFFTLVGSVVGVFFGFVLDGIAANANDIG